MTPTEAKASLARVQSYLDVLHEQDRAKITSEAAEIATAAEQRVLAFIAGLMADAPIPVSILQPFASYETFNKWRKDSKLTITKRNGKVCVRPSEFFRFWETLTS